MRTGRHQQLPERLRKSIQDQQERSEILISMIQLIIVTIFGLLYLLAPKTFGQEADFAPVPWVLALYLGFSLIRFRLALLRRLPDWMLYLSAVADIFLLLGLIWSFHRSTSSRRRFISRRPRCCTCSSSSASGPCISIRVSWWLPASAPRSAGCSWCHTWSTRTRSTTWLPEDHVEYMTSNSVLIGAEFDKVVSILMVTGVLALALQRARSLLFESVIEGSAARDLSRFVPEEVAQKVIHSEEGATTGKGEVAECSILFTDIEGFTAISESLAPESLIEALNRYFELVARPIADNGGVISQFQGDAILATFNLPRQDPEHAASAVRAALQIQQVVDGIEFAEGVYFNTRVGINTGRVVGGLVGSGDRVGYTVHGDNVNLAARLEQLNKEYGTRIVVADSTRERIADGCSTSANWAIPRCAA